LEDDAEVTEANIRWGSIKRQSDSIENLYS